MNSPEPINIGVSHQIGHYADAIRVPAGYEQIITSGPPRTEDGERDLARIGACWWLRPRAGIATTGWPALRSAS
jgi:hypothetical protein